MDSEKSKSEGSTLADDRPPESPPDSPLECPPTPERVPAGCKTPPSGMSKAKMKRKQKIKKRRSRSLDAAGQGSDEDGGRSSPEDGGCPICLGKIENKAKTDTCFHEFCFTCLVEWSKVKPVCPLCKGKFSYIMHKIVSDTEYERYDLPTVADQVEETLYGNLSDYLMYNRRFRYHTTLAYSQLNRRRDQLERQLRNHVIPQLPDRGRTSGGTTSGRSHFRRRRGPGTSEFRRQIYTSDLWVEPLPDISGRFRSCSPEWYRTNEAQTHRLIPFLNRELLALLEGGPHISQQAFVIQQMTEWVTRHEIMSPEMRDNLLPYLGIRTEHFQHELYNYARSTYDLIGYDNNVEYRARQLPAAEVVSSGSESDNPDSPAIASVEIVIPSSSRSNQDDQRSTPDRRNSQDGGLFSSASVIQSSLDILNPSSSSDRHRSKRRRESHERHFRSRSADRREDWRKWRKRHYKEASAAERSILDVSGGDYDGQQPSSSSSRRDRDKSRDRKRSRERKDDKGGKSSSNKGSRSSSTSSKSSRDKDRSKRDDDRKDKDKSGRDGDKKDKSKRDEAAKDKEKSSRDKDKSKKDKDKKDKDSSERDDSSSKSKSRSTSESKSIEGDSRSSKKKKSSSKESKDKKSRSRSKEGESSSMDGKSSSNDGKSRSKDGESKSKDKELRSKDGESKPNDGVSSIKDGDSRPKNGESRSKDSESSRKDGESSSKKGGERSKDDESRSKDGEGRSKDDESRSKDGQERSQDSKTRSKDVEPENSKVQRTGNEDIIEDLHRKTQERRSLDEVLANSCDAFGVPFLLHQRREEPERPPRPEQDILRRNAVAAQALRMNMQLNQLQELIARNRASASAEGAAAGTEKKKEDRSRRKNRKPSRFLRVQQDLQRNYPVLCMEEEEDPNRTIVLSPPPLRSSLNSSSDVVEVVEHIEELPDVIEPHTEIVVATSPPPSPGREIIPGHHKIVDAPIDLRMGSSSNVSLFELSAPSTSRGISGGPERLVVPMDESSSDSSEDAGIKHFSGPMKNPLGSMKNPSGPHILSESTGQLVPGAQEARLEASPHVSVLPVPVLPAAVPAQTRLSDSSDQDSDLEVLDVVQAKPRKTKDPEIVELSDSDEETIVPAPSDYVSSTPPPPVEVPFPSRPFDPNEPIEISSGSDSDDRNPAEILQDLQIPDFNQGMAMASAWEMFDSFNSNMEESEIAAMDKKKGKGRGKKSKPAKPAPDSSDEDDLIVVKTDYNTVDPITKREIVDPVKNKKCGHIYEKSTIYPMIDQARENQKPVRCPYMGCNCRDFTKKDLVKDREVLGHLEQVREERAEAKAEANRVEKEKRRVKAERRKNAGADSDQSADSIIEDVIELIKDGRKLKEIPKEKEIEEHRVSSSSSSSSPTSSIHNRSSESEGPGSELVVDEEKEKEAEPEKDTEKESESVAEKDKETAEPEKEQESEEQVVDASPAALSSPISSPLPPATSSPPKKKKRGRPKKKKEEEKVATEEKEKEDDKEKEVESDDSIVQPTKKKKKKDIASDSEESDEKEEEKKDSEPESRAEQDTGDPQQTKKSKRRRKVPERLNNSWSGSELDSDEAVSMPSPRKRKVGRVTKIKKVTETWVYEGDEEMDKDKTKKKGKGKKAESGGGVTVKSTTEGKKGDPKKGGKQKGKQGAAARSNSRRGAAAVPSYLELNSDHSDDEEYE